MLNHVQSFSPWPSFIILMPSFFDDVRFHLQIFVAFARSSAFPCCLSLPFSCVYHNFCENQCDNHRLCGVNLSTCSMIAESMGFLRNRVPPVIILLIWVILPGPECGSEAL